MEVELQNRPRNAAEKRATPYDGLIYKRWSTAETNKSNTDFLTAEQTSATKETIK